MSRLTLATGITVEAEVAGAGPRLLFVSGTGGDLRARPTVFETPLADRFTIAAYDQRGLGRSDIPDGPYSMAGYGDDAAAVLDALGWPDALVMGVSFGGMVAQELVLRHPTRVRRLVLACTSAGGAGGASYPLHELVALADEERLVRHLELSDVRMDAAWRAVNPARAGNALDLARERATVGAGEPRRTEGAALQLQARIGHDTWDRLPTITCPVFVCGGRFDAIASPQNLERLATAIPGASLRFYEGGHLFLWQDRQAFADVVTFLETGEVLPPAGA